VRVAAEIEGVRRFNPLTGLRPRIAALVLGGVLLLAAIMVQYSAHSLKGTYERGARTELNAIATTWEDGFDVSDLADPQLMQQRVQVLQDQNPHLMAAEAIPLESRILHCADALEAMTSSRI
jgi:chemotaxis protein histidine kinase CheA